MVAAVHDDPFRPEACGKIDIGLQVPIDRIAQEGRNLRDIHRGKGVEPEVKPMPLASLSDAGAAMIVEALQCVGSNVCLRIEIAHTIGNRPGDAILERKASAEIDANSILEAHRSAPLPRNEAAPTLGPKRTGRNFCAAGRGVQKSQGQASDGGNKLHRCAQGTDGTARYPARSHRMGRQEPIDLKILGTKLRACNGSRHARATAGMLA